MLSDSFFSYELIIYGMNCVIILQCQNCVVIILMLHLNYLQKIA